MSFMLSRLLCTAGIHRPVLPGVWNLGYCFSTCRRCDVDVVRSVLGGWKVPKSFKVIRTSELGAYDSLDSYLRSREIPRRPIRQPEFGAALPRSVPSSGQRRRPTGISGGSPFDFSDFEPGAGPAPQPLKNVKTG
jgi:hypothetical protein